MAELLNLKSLSEEAMLAKCRQRDATRHFYLLWLVNFWISFAGYFGITISAYFDEQSREQFSEKQDTTDLSRLSIKVLPYFVPLLGLSTFLDLRWMLQFLTDEICLSYLCHF